MTVTEFGNRNYYRLESVDRGQTDNPYITTTTKGNVSHKLSVSSQNPKDVVDTDRTPNGNRSCMRLPLTIKLFRKGLVWVGLLNSGDYTNYQNHTPGSLLRTDYDYDGKRLMGGMYMDQSRVSQA